jgi:hypothetical protein
LALPSPFSWVRCALKATDPSTTRRCFSASNDSQVERARHQPPGTNHRMRLPSPAAVVSNSHLRRAIRSFGTRVISAQRSSTLLGELAGDLPEPFGVVVIEGIRRDTSGMVGALADGRSLGAVFVVAAGDTLDVGTGR